MYFNKSLKKYLDDLAAKLPAPGGGSGAALVACLGAALISMVINFTLGKPKYAKYNKFLTRRLTESERIRKRFLELVDLDIVAYKSRNLDKALSVPLEVAGLCFKAIGICAPLVKKGNINLISDVAVAAILLEAGFCSALFNVRINLRNLKNKSRAEGLTRELNKKKNFMKKIRQDLEADIDEIIGG